LQQNSDGNLNAEPARHEESARTDTEVA